MRMFSRLSVILRMAVIVLLVAGVAGYFFWPQFNITVKVENIRDLQAGDKVYMDGQAIGEIRKVRQVAPGKGLIRIRMMDDYTNFLNTSTVFTMAGDRFIPERKALLCKNCNDDAPPIKSGHNYTGVGYLKYKISCFEKHFKGLQLTARELWESHGREIVLEAMESGKEMTKDTIDFLEEYEKEHHDDFVAFIELMKKEIKEITPEIQRQIDELLKK